MVSPKHQRKGIGTALLHAILEKYRHVRQIELAADNTGVAAAFYRAAGLREMVEMGCCGWMKG